MSVFDQGKSHLDKVDLKVTKAWKRHICTKTHTQILIAVFLLITQTRSSQVVLQYVNE
jgi:hypothetical protein